MHSVVEVHSTDVALVVPKTNAVAVFPSPNPVPLTVTVVPPAVDPVFGVSFVIVGVYANSSADEMMLVPLGVVTVTATIPAVPAGLTAVIEVADFTATPVALSEPNFTAVTSERFVPVMVTFVPPATGPLVVDSLVTVGGGGGVYSNSSADEMMLVPLGVVTVTATIPAIPTGLTAVIEVGDFTTVTPVALAEPNFTAVTS